MGDTMIANNLEPLLTVLSLILTAILASRSGIQRGFLGR
jgi:hypothetical protein